VVAPVGVGNSFSAGPCCGKAMREKLDDVAGLYKLTQLTTLSLNALALHRRQEMNPLGLRYPPTTQ
jgi:hypothetical protein